MKVELTHKCGHAEEHNIANNGFSRICCRVEAGLCTLCRRAELMRLKALGATKLELIKASLEI